MKKPALPAKRLARARIIELNGHSEGFELLLLVFMAPIWGILFPLSAIGLLAGGTPWYLGLVMVGGSLFCFVHFLHLYNNSFSFEEKGIRLPGVDHRVRPYSAIKRIYVESAAPLILAIEFVPSHARTYPYPNGEGQTDAIETKKPELEVQIIEVQHLTQESAREFWSLLAGRLRECAISLDVREKLVNWRTQSNKSEPAAQRQPDTNPTPSSRGETDKLFLIENSSQSTEIARDLSLLIELKPFKPLKLVAQYMSSYSDTFRKTWLTVWSIVAVFAYPLAVFSAATNLLKNHMIIGGSSGYETDNPIYHLPETNSFNQLQEISINSLSYFFGNYAGAIGLFFLVSSAIYKLIKHLSEPDSMFIDYMGITMQQRARAGVTVVAHRSWRSLENVKLIRPNKKSNSSRWTIVFESNEGRPTIEIPFKVLSSGRLRQQFVECLDIWGRSANIDTSLLENLSPKGQTSFTELWLSGLSEAPKIDVLTPHSVGLRLRTRNYEVLHQLASGGQGVAYLAKKVQPSQDKDSKSPVSQTEDQTEVAETTSPDHGQRLVLKETVLPIFVDERARAKAIARFERDAKLLASLDHPLIVKLEDFFVENNRALLALEYIEGQTLKEKVDSDGPIAESEVIRLAIMMADILQYLHGRIPPVVHRDFTPDNLILMTDGRLKLIDFDVALEQNSYAQSNSTIVGKQAYIPLEQFRGKPCPQSDIYALGASLTFLLTGLEPAALEASHPRKINNSISQSLDNFIAQTTSLELKDRIIDAATARARLSEISHSEVELIGAEGS